MDTQSKRKINIPSEVIYILANVLISFSVAMSAAADFGVSMVVGTAYVFSLKFPVLTFGQWEYVIQGAVFISFCIIVRKIKLTYFVSFFTCLFYGALLDLWRYLIPAFSAEAISASGASFGMRIFYFIASMVITALAVAMYFRTYIYSQVYEFFVKGISSHFSFKITRVKYIFDFTCLAVATALSLIFFRGFNGVGIGTLILTVCNGFLIGFFNKLLDRIDTRPLFPKFAEHFE